jgi:hypothetical protein
MSGSWGSPIRHLSCNDPSQDIRLYPFLASLNT